MDKRSIYHRVVELWIYYKNLHPESNPSAFIINELTGQSYSGQEPKTAVEVMEIVGSILGFPSLSEDERNRIDVEASMKIPGFSPNKGGFNILTSVVIMSALKWVGYGLGLFSIFYSGFSWWVAGFIIAFWWAGGAARMAAQKQRIEPGPRWEMPAHILVHIATLIGLFIVSIKHIL